MSSKSKSTTRSAARGSEHAGAGKGLVRSAGSARLTKGDGAGRSLSRRANGSSRGGAASADELARRAWEKTYENRRKG